MRRLCMLAALIAASFGIASITGGAAADTITPNPITFEPGQGYHTGNIDGQNGWAKTGAYDVAVADASSVPAIATLGFGAQALRLSDAVTTGGFGDQTFTPALSQPAGEAQAQTHFEASFSIGTALATEQTGLHMSVSPDNGSGGRMSYLRFEDQADGVHVFFDDVTDPGPYYTPATFNEAYIATLSRASAHTIRFSIDFKPGPANDVVEIYIDGVLKATGTTWEDYYRYDNEGGGAGAVPTTSNILFRESGAADPDNAGNGFLVDNVSFASSTPPPPCAPTGFVRDSINLTAKIINPSSTVTGPVDATGCNIGVYYGSGQAGSVSGANVFGANYFGVVADGATVDIAGSQVHNIGEVPFNGTQHGNAIYYTNAASGTISGNTVSQYQKNGITAVNGSSVTISGNTVTGQGPVDYIGQNGIEVGSGATGTVQDNTVSGNAYTGPNNASSGGILVFGGPAFGVPYTTGVQVVHNTLTNNDVGIYLYNADASGNAPKTQTKNGAVNNTITNGAYTNTTGFGAACGYQAGISELGNKDNIVNNKISGTGYTPVHPDCSGTPPEFIRAIDTTGSQAAHVNNNK